MVEILHSVQDDRKTTFARGSGEKLWESCTIRCKRIGSSRLTALIPWGATGEAPAIFAKHYMRSPEEMGEQEVRDFLLYLGRGRQASPATLDMYVNALKFFYTITRKRPEAVKGIFHPKRPKTLPVILSPEEVLLIFAAIRPVKHKAVIATAYAAGLRIFEVCGPPILTASGNASMSARGRAEGSLCHAGREPSGPVAPVLPESPATRRVSVPGI
jgi:integrase